MSVGELEDYTGRDVLASIKNDSKGTGVNSGDTSRLFGRWLKMKLSLASVGGTQKLINAIVKFRVSPRLYNQ
jgi:hypothetical protein